MKTEVTETDETKIRLLYEKLLESWNNNNPGDFANLFAENGNTIGFDGSHTPAAFHGRPELSRQLTEELQQVYDKQL